MNPEEFYDNFTKKLLLDYLNNNKRMSAAIKMVLSNIPKTSKRILDIGCGIGWSTREIASHFNDAVVSGIDLSTNSIKVADTLFKLDNNTFDKVDVTSHSFKAVNNNKFDVVVMIDVLEHIPLEKRDDFIQSIKQLLSGKGRFIVSCPTIYQQNYLKKKGEGLQPVDEDLTLPDIQKIAEQLDGEVSLFKNMSIWHTNDYFYAMVEKGLEFQSYQSNLDFEYELERIDKRFERVKRSGYIKFFSDEEISRLNILSKNIKKGRTKKRIKEILGI